MKRILLFLALAPACFGAAASGVAPWKYPSPPTNGQVWVYSTADGAWEPGSGSGSGTVTGPGSSTNTAIAIWSGTGGMVIANSPVTIDGSGNIVTPGNFSVAQLNFTSINWSGSTTVVPAPNGGTGVANGSNNNITFTGNYTLGLTLTSNTALTLPTSGTLLTTTGSGAGLTSLNGSAVASGTVAGTYLAAINLAASGNGGVTGVLTATNGGTGLSSLGSGVATWLGTPSGANLASALTSALTVGGGGTGATTYTTDGVLYYTGSVIASTSAGTVNYVLTSNGAGVAPTFQPAAGGSTGISGATANGAMYATGSTTGSSTGALTNGQVLIGYTGNNPVAATLTQGSNITITNGNGTITIAATSGGTSAPPSATIGLSAVNGSASTFMTSDSAPPLSQTIVPTWTGLHTFSITDTSSSGNAHYGLVISPTVNQTSTAGFEALRVAETVTAAGSGTQNLINLLAGASGTTSEFAVTTAGAATLTTSLAVAGTTTLGNGSLIGTGNLTLESNNSAGAIFFNIQSTSFVDVSNNGILQVGQASKSINNWLTAGTAFQTGAVTYTNNNSAAGATVATAVVSSFAQPTLRSTNGTGGSPVTATDAFTVYIAGPPLPTAGSGTYTITNPHSLGIVDSTSAASSITGGLIVSAMLGTTATSVGIGGGNVNAGGTVTAVGLLSSGGLTLSGANYSNTVTLASGAGTITDASITTSSVIAFSLVTSSGTPGTYPPLATVSAGSATVTGIATDNSTYRWKLIN